MDELSMMVDLLARRLESSLLADLRTTCGIGS